ncbi:hypothetical protein [Halothermothrix orenii]|uniref:hypothetical protein n=1 Tax=Halothermothrix orenii TaxID=31909 RepID=UPI000318D49A|nr:hypothetical protein [Halothermothrix orenii]
MVNYNDIYDDKILKKVAESCPEFSSAYDSPFASAGSLVASQDGLGDRICNECTHWNQGTCSIFQKHKDKYQ